MCRACCSAYVPTAATLPILVFQSHCTCLRSMLLHFFLMVLARKDWLSGCRVRGSWSSVACVTACSLGRGERSAGNHLGIELPFSEPLLHISRTRRGERLQQDVRPRLSCRHLAGTLRSLGQSDTRSRTHIHLLRGPGAGDSRAPATVRRRPVRVSDGAAGDASGGGVSPGRWSARTEEPPPVV